MANGYKPSESAQIFADAIRDAESIVTMFSEKSKGNPAVAIDLEYLKRSGLILAMVAWETYVKNCLRECVETRLSNGVPEFAKKIIREQMEVDIKAINNPDRARTKKIYLDYTEVDLTEGWETTQTDIDGWIKLRGEAAHKSRHLNKESGPHLVTIPKLKTIINGLRRLVETTDKTLMAKGVLKPCAETKEPAPKQP